MKNRFCHNYAHFWKENPAFFVGIFFLLGIVSYANISYVWILLLLCTPFLLSIPMSRYHLHKVFMAVALAIASFFFHLNTMQHFSKLPEETIGKALFYPIEIKTKYSPFGSSTYCKGTCSFFEENSTRQGHQIPCLLYFSPRQTSFTADSDYLIEGVLNKKSDTLFCLTPAKTKEMLPLKDTYSFAKWRHECKHSLSSYIKKKIPSKKSAHFLSALCTGELEENMLSFSFSQVGLQHILAISGFHFALLCAILRFALQRLFPLKLSYLLLLIAMTSYFFFLGAGPSVTRSWIAITIYLLARMFAYQTSAINALGVGLTIELLIDPLVVHHLSFQLSFLCTAAILLLYPLSYKVLCVLFPERTQKQLSAFSLKDRTGYRTITFLRSALAVNVAVHVASIPVCLFHFHKFPLLASFAYNLFFPLLVSASVILLLASIALDFVLPSLAGYLFDATSLFTKEILQVVASFPSSLRIDLHSPSMPCMLVVTFLSMLLFVAIYNRRKPSIFFGS